MNIKHIKPDDIEKRSMEIIESELCDTPHLTKIEKQIVKRVIHTTADFDYLQNLEFSENAVESGLQAILSGTSIITDTNMSLAGISKPALKALGCEIFCFTADNDVAESARSNGTTRAVAAVDKAASLFGNNHFIYAVGNAPTALIRLYELIGQKKISPALIIGVPVGFVNVVYSKELIMTSSVPYIVAKGRKGGSTVAAAICNALLYQLYRRQK